MKRYFLIFFFFLIALGSRAQKVDSIYFHLYTDSLKKGQHNYINVDGKMSDGTWNPLGEKELIFSSTDGQFQGNELILPMDFKPKKVLVKAVLRSNPSIWKEVTIYIKQLPDPLLPTRDEMPASSGRRNRGGY